VFGVQASACVWLFLAQHTTGTEPDLLFHVSYNGQTEKADYAAGEAESLNFARTLQYLQAPGVISAGFQTLDNERCDYAMPGNFDPRQGSLSLWVRAENWRPTDMRGYAFFVAEIPGKYKLLLSKPATEAVLALEITGAAPVKSPVLNWQPTEWHQVVVTWNAESLTLYVDGGLVGEAKGAAFPAPEPAGSFSVNPNNWFKEPFSSPADKTSVDEVKVYDTILMTEAIRREYADLRAQMAGGVYRRPQLTIPLRKTPPTLDGKLAVGEWDTATKVPLLCRMGRHEVAEKLGTVQLMYDAENLYLGFHATGVNEPLTKYNERDSWVWEDAAIEFIWETAEPTRARFQIVVNSANTIFDMKNGDAKWNGVTRSAAGLDGDGWSTEVALSFQELGVELPKPGVIWTGNFMHDWDQRSGGYATWAYSLTADGSTMSFGNSAVFGTLAFGDDAPAVRLESVGDLLAGKVDARVAAAPDWKATLRLGTGPPATGSLATNAPLGKDSLLAITVTDAAGHTRFVYDAQFQPKPPIVIAYKCWPHLRRLDVTLDLSNAPEGDRRGEVSLTDADGKQTLSKAPVTATNALAGCALPFPTSLPPGKYTVRAMIGTVVATRPFEVPHDHEVNSTAGMDHTVPEPWTPVAVSGRRVKVLNREYMLGASPFPVRMKSLGEDVLAQPVTWFVTTDRGEERVAWDAPRVKQKRADNVTFTGRGRLRKAGIQFDYEATLDFDGQWLAKVTMSPPKAEPAEIKTMRLEYAVATGSATYALAPLLRTWEGDRLLLDLFESIDEAANSRAAMGHFWLTSLKTGLHFFTPTDGNWVYQKGKPNVRIERGKETARVTLLMIHKPVTLTRPATYPLGLTATPTKPQPRRSWNSGDHEWIFQLGKWQSWISLVPRDPAGLRKSVEEKRRKGFKFLYQYSCAFVLGDNSGYEDYWGATWAGKQPMTGTAFGGCPNSTLANVVVAHVDRLAREFGIGPYFDMYGIDWCGNAAHGCGYTDSFGRAAKTTPMLSAREQLKRIYRITHRNGCRVFSHNHSLWVLPVHTFTDIWLPGEQYASAVVGKWDNFYTHHVPRTDWLVEMNPFIHGAQMVFIHQFARGADLAGFKDFEKWYRDDHAWAAEQSLAMTLPHDIEMSHGYVCATPAKRIADIYGRFGITLREEDPRRDAQFTGYWGNPTITADDPEVLVSCYTRRDSPDVLAVLSNPTAQAKTVRLKMKSDRWTVRDEYRNEDLPQWREGITVPKQNFRLLWMKPQ
jgi:hypothetical protein